MDSQSEKTEVVHEKASAPPTISSTEKNLFLAICAYVGPLVILSFLFGKENSFVKFHTKQGLVLFSIEIIMWLFGQMFYSMWGIVHIVNIFTFVLSIVGIVNVIRKKEKELPLLGHLSKNFKF